jgi:integrase
VLQPLVPAQVGRSVAAATTPATRLILALAAVHAARVAQIGMLMLDDVDLGNRRLTIAGRVRPLDDLTLKLLLDWLEHRRNRWPSTANLHLLINNQTPQEENLARIDATWSRRQQTLGRGAGTHPRLQESSRRC